MMSILRRFHHGSNSTSDSMKYKITYEVIREVESDTPFPKEVIKKNLLNLKKENAIPNWLVTSESMTSVTIKSVKEIK